MKLKVDKDRLNDVLRLYRRMKRSGYDDDIYRLILKEVDGVQLERTEFSSHGSHINDILRSVFYFVGNPSNQTVYDILADFNIEVVGR